MHPVFIYVRRTFCKSDVGSGLLMLPQIFKRLGAIMASVIFYLFYHYLLLLSFSGIWKELIKTVLSKTYSNAYSDANGKVFNKYAVTFLLVGLD